MNQESCAIPLNPKIETEELPIEWLYGLALCEGNSKKPIYRIHKWWARRLGSVFRMLLLLAVKPNPWQIGQIIDDFYSKHDQANLVVLDPFMGGGTSIIEASKFGARTIGVEIDPVAWFVTKKEIEPCPVGEVKKAVEYLENSVGKEIQSYYLTQTPDGQMVPAIYFFWVDQIICPNCGLPFEAHPHYQLALDKKSAQQTVFCRKCHAVETISLSQTSFTCSGCGSTTEIERGTIKRGRFTCPGCKHSDLVVSVIKAGQPLPKQLFAVEYETKNPKGEPSRSYKAADVGDIELFKKAERMFHELENVLPFPRAEIPTEKRNDPRPISHGYRYYHQLFNSRQLLCLSLLWRKIIGIKDDQVREYLMIAFSDSLSSNNLLCSYAFGYQKLTPLFGLHAFNVVNRPVENNVWGTYYGRGSFLKCVNKMLIGKEYADQPYELKYYNGKPTRVFTGERVTAKVTFSFEEWRRGDAQSLLINRSSTELGYLEAGSVDLVLTDPPYYNNLSYSELSDFFYVWLRDYLPADGHGWNDETTPYQRALYVAENDDPSHQRFTKDLTEIFMHCKRALKADGLMVFTFHHRDLNAWKALAISLWKAGFEITNNFPVRSEGRSGFHSTSGTIKWDAVLVCRQRKTIEVSRGNDKQSFLSSLKSDQIVWESRLKEAKVEFQWIDSLSLGYAIAMRQAIARSATQEDILEFLSEANKFLLSRLSPSQLKLVS